MDSKINKPTKIRQQSQSLKSSRKKGTKPKFLRQEAAFKEIVQSMLKDTQARLKLNKKIEIS